MQNEKYAGNKVTKKSLHFFEISQEKPFLKLSVQVMRLKNKDKSAKIKVQENVRKFHIIFLLKCYKLLLLMH